VIFKGRIAQISFSLPESVLDKSKAPLQAITKLACGLDNCNRRSYASQDLFAKMLSMADQRDIFWATGCKEAI
jgi:hypothetical protein